MVMLDKDLSPKSVRNYVGTLTAMLGFAVGKTDRRRNGEAHVRCRV